MRAYLSTLFVFLFILPSFSQSKGWVDSRSYIVGGMGAIQDQNYETAVEEFNKISPSDTNYALAQLELALSYTELEKDSVVIKICNDAIALETKWDHIFREYLIESMSRLKNEEVFEQIALAKQKYPFNEDFILLEAVANKKWENYDQAIKVLQKLIQQNPFNKNAHYYLGQMMADKGDFVRATISLEAFLMLSSSSNGKTSSALIILSNIFSNKHEITIKNAKKDKLFKEVEELIESELSLKKGYKTDAPLDDPIVRQTDVLVKNIEYKKGTNDFWMDFYVPFINKIKSQGLIRGYTYQFLSFLDHEGVQAGVKKFKPEVDKFIKFAADYFDDIRQKAAITVQGSPVVLEKWYDEGNISSMGKKDGENRTGTWYFFYPAGSLETIMHYNNAGKRNDSVFNYHLNGKLKDCYAYQNDVLQGKYLEYYKNGQLHSELIYKDDSLQGMQKTYYPNGATKETVEFKKGKRHGMNKEYDVAGNQESELQYKDGKLEGLQKRYYPGMILEREIYYKGGKRDGSCITYHKNGKISAKGNYVAGIVTGTWEEYFSNGKREKYYTLNDKGDYTDSLLTYHHNGQLASVTHFNKKGQKEGLDINYASDGKVLNIFIYKKDAIKSWKYFAADGKELASGTKTLMNYNKYGNLESKGDIAKGVRTGRWEFYYPNGAISGIGNYTLTGELDGSYEEYYQSGEIKSKTSYSNGSYNGPFVSYHENKKVQSEGWYAEGEHAGEWTWYYVNGNPEQTDYYINDKATGMITDWNADSTIDYTRKIKDEVFQGIYFYGPDNKERVKLDTKNGNGSFKYSGENNVIEYNRTYQYGVLHGKVTQTLKSTGALLNEENYSNGYLNGKQIYRYPNGQISLEAEYVFGDETGTWKYYSEDGTISLLRHYTYGRSCDSTVWYYASGAPRIKEYYNDMGQISGITLWYYENGKIKKHSRHAFNDREGWTYDYDPEGRLMYKRWFENGNVVLLKGLSSNGKDSVTYNLYEKSDSITLFFDNGKPALCCRYDKGMLQGHWAKYFYDGKVMEEDVYVNDVSNGTGIDYYINGKVMQKESRYMGVLHGAQLTYYENGQLRGDEKQYMGNANGEYKVYNKKGELIIHADYRHGVLIKNHLK